MLTSLALSTHSTGNEINDFTFIYKDHIDKNVREIMCAYRENDSDCIVMHDFDLPRGKTYEVRSEGIWSEFMCETENEHWSFSMESFALRVPISEYIAAHKANVSIEIGERVPFGYELDCTHEGGQWNLSGFVLVGKNEIQIDSKNVEFSLTDD